MGQSEYRSYERGEKEKLDGPKAKTKKEKKEKGNEGNHQTPSSSQSLADSRLHTHPVFVAARIDGQPKECTVCDGKTYSFMSWR